MRPFLELSLVLSTVWEQINTDANNDPNVDNTETEAHFDERLREFISVHSTADDCYEWVQYLRACCKPRELPVQAFWYKLRKLNSYIMWIPGNEPSLTDPQMKQAFHDGMQNTWRERFTNAGNSISTITMAEVVPYFRKQEALAAKTMIENTRAQKRESALRRTDKKKPPSHCQGHDSRR